MAAFDIIGRFHRDPLTAGVGQAICTCRNHPRFSDPEWHQLLVARLGGLYSDPIYSLGMKLLVRVDMSSARLLEGVATADYSDQK